SFGSAASRSSHLVTVQSPGADSGLAAPLARTESTRPVQRETRALDENEVASTRFDALDRKLITALQSAPRRPYATLGARLNVTGMTAANRLQRLRQAELVDIRVRPNFAACGLETDILGLLSADAGVLPSCVDLLSASPYVLRIDRVTGEYDISFHA